MTLPLADSTAENTSLPVTDVIAPTEKPSTEGTFMAFNLPEVLQRAIAKLGFTAPTPIQAQAVPVGLAGKDLIGSAQTGSGKTAAFGIPLLAKLLTDKNARALVLAPTRELAGQIQTVLTDLAGRDAQLRPVLIIGGVSLGRQRFDLRRKPRIMVATPGRLVDHISDDRNLLADVKVLVLDEADRMLDLGFAPQLNEIQRHLPKERQTLLFSATYPSDIADLAAKWLKDPTRISVGSVVRPVEAIDQQTLEVDENRKESTLLNELNTTEGSVLIFTRTKRRADKLTMSLRDKGVRASQIHGGRSQYQRVEALDGFRAGKFRVLVATDIAARGIDVPSIAHVINYDLPLCPEDYLHRIGRTARGGKEGRALCLISPSERPIWRAIERLMARQGGRSSQEQRDEARELRGPSMRRGGSEGGRSEGRRSFGGRSEGGRSFGGGGRSFGGGGFGRSDRQEGRRFSPRPERDGGFGAPSERSEERGAPRTGGASRFSRDRRPPTREGSYARPGEARPFRDDAAPRPFRGGSERRPFREDFGARPFRSGPSGGADSGSRGSRFGGGRPSFGNSSGPRRSGGGAGRPFRGGDQRRSSGAPRGPSFSGDSARS